ncbi:unnamed protein product [Medioppia subpectinata]|uniref:Ig-like domain-containing protein n=1 Tax=Medioppia subpectinata TaxID=1979941 RepID=A0A7R9KHR0_9ACAR|nr:unnamed protein product [Medioppia subpectinata]CAG2103872.1 unnamed protein product [Medioppia subpectinata]
MPIYAFPEQQAVLGSSVSLPCEITAPGMSTDSVTLILWYRGDDISGAPIYSIDARSRNTPLESAKHFIADDYEGRAVFDISVRPALLKLGPIVDTDGGQYWCRVDFRWTRTTISSVLLSVVGMCPHSPAVDLLLMQ